jgi:hypothetical protein
MFSLKVLKDIISNMHNASEKDRKDIMKELLKQMDRGALEEMIRNMDLPDDVKAKMLNDLRNMPGNFGILIAGKFFKIYFFKMMMYGGLMGCVYDGLNILNISY